MCVKIHKMKGFRTTDGQEAKKVESFIRCKTAN